MKSRISFSEMIFASLLLVIAGCTSQTVKMIQPQTGATAECSGSSYGFGQLFSESFVDSCTRAYENRGYVAAAALDTGRSREFRAARPAAERLVERSWNELPAERNHFDLVVALGIVARRFERLKPLRRVAVGAARAKDC